MCGIAGLYDPGGRFPRRGALVRSMTRILRHRGPDDEGFFEDGPASLGHRRLSIIDLDSGRQPIANEDGSVVVVFNGEIYNFRELRRDLEAKGHVFRTRSDTEVIVHLWEDEGEACVSRLRGMFAFALYDRTQRLLFLARDRLGVKPLFLAEVGGALAFASEAKALLEIESVRNSGVSETAIAEYARFRFASAPGTFFRAVRKLLPGSVLVATPGGVRESRYWDVPEPGARSGGGSLLDYVSEARERLAEAVRLRLVADVPVGAFLSGGLDSSLLVALMRREGSASRVRTFSVGVDDESIDESRAARATACALGTEHFEVRVAPADLSDGLDLMVAHRDGPLSEPSDLALERLAELASRSVKVVLSGEGADEVFGGYWKYVVEGFRPLFSAMPRPFRAHVLAPLASRLPARMRRVTSTVRSLSIEDEPSRYADYFASCGEGEAESVLEPEFLARANGASGADSVRSSVGRVSGAPRLFRMQYADMRHYLPDNLLERGDRLTMAHSIEGRVPYLDHPLVEFASRVPPRLKVSGLRTKRLLREIARDLVPATVLSRKKIGFAVPVSAWLRGPLRARAEDALSSRAFRERGVVRPEAVTRLLGEHARGRADHGRTLWALLNLESFFRWLDGRTVPLGAETGLLATRSRS